MIEMRKLREIVKLMVENDLCEVDIRDADEHVSLKRPNPEPVQVVTQAPMMAAPAPIAPAAPATPAAPAAAPADDTEGLEKITSPMVGTFYTSPSPDADAFVKVGAAIGPDSVVCLIEAMKVFNEIKAEVSGKIEKVLVGNGDAVEFGQPLFLVRPG